jgi:pimeloyl-ACP methyl ester carboxylesterase
MGEVSVERLSIESSPGRSVELLVYSPRTANHIESMPVMLTIHGLTGSKEGLYAFNIELARRNFTVVSLDLPGHGDSSLAFDITDFNEMAQDAYAAVRHVQTAFTNVDNESYGVLTHSLGFRVAIELKDFPVAPRAYVAVGDVGKISDGEYVDFPENLLFAIGSFDEIVTQRDALEAIRNATGSESAVAGVTYGSLDSQTANRLVFGPSNHVFEVVDTSLVSEAVSWLVQGVQGEAQLLDTRDPTDQVYYSKNIASILSTFFILISVIPIMWLTYSFLPEKLKPRRIKIDTQSYPLRRTFEISSLLGGGMVLIFNIALVMGLVLEDSGVSWLNSMSGTGLILFFIFGAVGLLIIMRLLIGQNNTGVSLSSVGVERLNIKNHAIDILKNLFVACIGIVWFIFWLGLAGSSQTQPGILLVLIKWPIGIRWTSTIILAILAIPFLLVEAAWIRGLLMNKREWKTQYQKTASLLYTLFSKFAIAALLTIITIFVTTAAGVSGGRIVLIGVIWVRILIIQVLAAVITAWASLEFENTLSAVIVSSFILSLVMMTTIPLI